MNILFDLNHPAHYHLFKNFIHYLKLNKHNIHITIRDKDVLRLLLDNDILNYEILSTASKHGLKSIKDLFISDIILLKHYKKNKIDIAFGTSISISHLSAITKVKSYNFNEDDDFIDPIYEFLAYPFSTHIINPDCLNIRYLKTKRIIYNSYHELAYLHPNNFIPDKQVLLKYNLKEKQYIIFRKSALNATHDLNAKGISDNLRVKIENTLKDFNIIYSYELTSKYKIEPWEMHHVLAYAKMIICDSQTMAAEAMVLGVPSIRINSFVGRISYLEELENKYNLGFGFLPTQINEREIISTIQKLISDSNVENIWQEKKENMLSEKCDLNQWMINYFEKEIKD